MARVEIYLEDEGDGIAMAVRHVDGFNPESKAHKMANQVVKFLDDHADWKKNEREETTDLSRPALDLGRPGLVHL